MGTVPREGGFIMKWFQKLSIVLVGVFLLVGCEQSLGSEEVQTLSERLLHDYEVYFEQSLDLNSFSVGGEAQSGLINRETDEPIYGGNRIGFVLKREPKENEVYRVTGEYKDEVLQGIRVDINTTKSEYSEQSLEQICVEFLNEHQLAEAVSLLGVTTAQDGATIIYKFEEQNQRVIKVYVNQDLKQVVGFLLYDGVDL